MYNITMESNINKILKEIKSQIESYNINNGNRKFLKGIVDLPGIAITLRDGVLVKLGELHLYIKYESYREKYDSYIENGLKKEELKKLNDFKINNFSKKNSENKDELSIEIYGKFGKYSDNKAGRKDLNPKELEEFINYLNDLIDLIWNKKIDSGESDGEYKNEIQLPHLLFQEDKVPNSKLESFFPADLLSQGTDEWKLNTLEYTLIQITRFITKYIFDDTPEYLRWLIETDDNYKRIISNRLTQRLDEIKVDNKEIMKLRKSLEGIWQNNNLLLMIDDILEKREINHWDIFNIIRKYQDYFNEMEYFKCTGIKLNELIEMLDTFTIEKGKEISFKYINEIQQIYSNYDENVDSESYSNNIDILNNKLYINWYDNNEIEFDNNLENGKKIDKLFTFFNIGDFRKPEIIAKRFYLHNNDFRLIRKKNMESFWKTYAYYMMTDKYSLNEIFKILKKYKWNDGDDNFETYKILFVYEKFKEYFDLNVNEADGNGTIGYGVGTKVYMDTEYIDYIFKLKKARSKFIETFVIPISKSIENMEENLRFLIHNDLRRIVHRLDRTWFFIHSEFYDIDEFFINMGKRFIFEEIIMSMTKWSSDSDDLDDSEWMLSSKTGTRWIEEKELSFNSKIYENEWWEELFSSLESLKDKAYKCKIVQISVKGNTDSNFEKFGKYKNYEDFNEDWENWINHLKNEQKKIMTRFSDEYIEKLKDEMTSI